jgi:6-phosphogluconolactonase (cycloisomerase 2 family)
MTSRHFTRLLPVLAFLLLLFACGGTNNSAGNNSGSSNTPTAGGSSPGSSNPGGSGSGGSGASSSSAGEYVYAVSAAANDQSTFTVYSVDANSGALSKVNSATIPVRAVTQIIADSTGVNAYVTGYQAPSPNMDLVKVTASSGTISPFQGQTFQAVGQNEGNCCPSALAVDPSGQTSYVGGLNDYHVHFYTVDKSTGVWTEKATYLQPGAGGEVYALALDPTAKFLYTAQRGSSKVSGFSRASDGSLTPLPGSPFETSALTSTVSISPDGKWLFVPHYEVSAFDIYKINADGTLSISQANVAAGSAPYYAATDPQERFLYVSNAGGYNGSAPGLNAYKFDSATGQATPIPGGTYNVKQSTLVRIDPSGKFLYIASAQVEGFTIDQRTGALTPISGTFPSEANLVIVKP